jgi:hypothetical protein
VRLRRQSGSTGRPLNFTVRGTVSGDVLDVSSSCFPVTRFEEPFVSAAQLPTRSSSGCAAAWTRAFCLGGFVEPDLLLGVGAARRRAVSQCQGARVPSFDINTSPSNNRWRGP